MKQETSVTGIKYIQSAKLQVDACWKQTNIRIRLLETFSVHERVFVPEKHKLSKNTDSL